MAGQNIAGVIKAMLRFTICSLSTQSSNHTAIELISMRVILFLLCLAAIVLLYSRDVPRRQRSLEPISGTEIGAIADKDSADEDTSLGRSAHTGGSKDAEFVPWADDAETSEDETDKEVWRTSVRLKCESITDNEELTVRVISQIAPFDIPIQEQWTLSGSEQQVDKQVSPRVFPIRQEPHGNGLFEQPLQEKFDIAEQRRLRGRRRSKMRRSGTIFSSY
jgi:hypothetical protein